jgi:hypothetical protein
MGMLDDPLLHLDAQPEAIDTKGDDGQQKPLYVIAKQLSAVSIKSQPATIDDGVLCHPAFPAAHGPRRTQAKGKELQKRFVEKFGALRCQDLLRDPKAPAGPTAAATAMGLTGHCDIMIVTAVEIVEQILAEEK